MRYYLVYVKGEPKVVIIQKGAEQVSGLANTVWHYYNCKCDLLGTVTSEYEIIHLKDLSKWFRRNGLRGS